MPKFDRPKLVLAFIAALFSLLSVTVSAQDSEQGTAASQRPAGTLNLAIVVDNSGSYRTIFERVLTSTKSIIQDLRPGEKASLVTFVNSDKIVLRQALTDTKAELMDAAENMFIEGGATAIIDAVAFAGKNLVESSGGDGGERVLVLITDGDERQSVASLDETIASLKKANVRVLVLGLHEEKFYSKVADRLCRETGGAKFVPKLPKDTAATVASLISSLRSP